MGCSITLQTLILTNNEVFEENRGGSLLKMLLTQMEDDPDLQRAVFTHYVSNVTFPKLYAKNWLRRESGLDGLPLHDLIALLANRKSKLDRVSSVLIQGEIQVRSLYQSDVYHCTVLT